MAAGADTTLRDKQRRTALHFAKGGQHHDCARAIQDRAKATAPPPCKENEVAAATERSGMLPQALSNALVSDVRRGTPMRMIILAQVRTWLDSGGHVDATTYIDSIDGRFTMLMLAAADGNAQLLDLLIARNATIDLRLNGRPAIVLAISALPALLLPQPCAALTTPCALDRG